MKKESERIKILRDKLEKELLKLDEAFLNGNKDHRLYNISNIGFKRAGGESLMTALNKNIAISSGSACTSASPEPSHVLKAMGLNDDLAHASLRFSLGRFTTEEEIDYTIDQVRDTVKLREQLANLPM
jgi:cysteine desulfurase